jgi:hypothetical protein
MAASEMIGGWYGVGALNLCMLVVASSGCMKYRELETIDFDAI